MAVDIGTIKGTIVLRDQFTRQLVKASTQMKKTGQQMKSFGKSLTVGLTLPITALGIAVTKMGQSFDKEMTKIETLVGVDSKLVQKFEKDIIALGPAVGKGPKELAEALFVVTSAGERTSAAMEIVTQAAKASAVGLGDTAVIARSVTAAMQAYGKTGLDASRATDVLVATVREGNLEAASLAGSLGRVIGIASQVGVTFEDVGSFIATFTRLGVGAEEAVTSLRGTLNVLLKPTKEARETLNKFGLTAAGLRQKIKDEGLAETLILLKETFKGNDEELVRVIPNVRALAGVLGTAGAQAEAFIDISEKLRDSQGILTDAFKTTSERITFSFQMIGARFSQLGTRLGSALEPILMEKVIPAINALIDKLEQAVNWFENLTEGEKTATVSVALFAAALGPAIFALGSVVSGIGFFANGLRVIIGLLPTATVAATKTTASLATYGTTVAKIAPVTTSFVSSLTSMGTGAVSALPSLTAVGAVAIPAMVAAAGGFIGLQIGKHLNEMAIASRGGADAIDEAVEKVGLFKAGLSLVPDLLAGVWGLIKNTTASIWEWIKSIPELIGQFVNWVGELTIVTKAVEFFKMAWELLGPVGEAVVDIITRVINVVKETAQEILDFIGTFGDVVDRVQSVIQEVGAGLFSFREESVDPMATATDEAKAAFDEFVKSQQATAGAVEKTTKEVEKFNKEGEKTPPIINNITEAQKDLIAQLEKGTFASMQKEMETLDFALVAIGIENLTDDAIKKLIPEAEKMGELFGDKIPESIQKLIDKGKELRKAQPITQKDIEHLGNYIPPLEKIDKIVLELGPVMKKWGSIMTGITPEISKQGEEIDETGESLLDFSQLMEDLSNIMNVFGIEADSALGKVVSGVGTLIGTLPAILNFNNSIIASAENAAEAIQQSATAIAAGIAAIANATAAGSTGQRALGGAMAGAGVGAQVGGPIGAAIGAAAGALVGFFRGRGAEQFKEDLEEAFEVPISEALSEAIKKSGQNAQLFIAEIFGENLLLGIEGSADKFAEEIGDLFSVFEQGDISEPELIRALKESLPLLIENFDELGPVGEEQLERIISAADRFGIELEEIDALMQAAFAPDTVQDIMEAFGLTNEEVRKLEEQLGIKIQTDLQRMAATLGLSVDEMKALGKATEEEYGVPLEDIDKLLEALGVSAEELAEALGVEVKGGNEDLNEELEETTDEMGRSADEAERLARALERAARAAGGINVPSGGDTTPGMATGGIAERPMVTSIAETEPELVAPVRSLFTTLSNQIVDKLMEANKGSGIGPAQPVTVPTGSMNMTMVIDTEVLGNVIANKTKDGTFRIHPLAVREF